MNFVLNLGKYWFAALVIMGCSTTSNLRKKNPPTHKTPRKNVSSGRKDASDSVDSIGSFPLVFNQDVEKWIQYFQTSAHRSFVKWTERGEPFRLAIEETLESEGVPAALFYMSLVESGFVHQAASPAQASGPWQFIKETGERYGLKSNDWIDERRDPVKSTHAAAAYLRDLNKRFGDWYLVLAAYNSGPKAIRDAINKAGTSDFWELKKAGVIKRETGDFVPKTIAAIIIGTNPLKYGFPEKVMNAKPSFPKSVIKLKGPVKIEELARKLDLSPSKLKEWNPELLKAITPPRKYSKGAYALRVDQSHADIFDQIETQLSYVKIKEVHIHKIVKGETLHKLAKLYDVPLKTLLEVNPQLHSRKLAIGTKISVPVSETHS